MDEQTSRTCRSWLADHTLPPVQHFLFFWSRHMNTSQQYPATPDFDKGRSVAGNFLFSSDTSVRQCCTPVPESCGDMTVRDTGASLRHDADADICLLGRGFWPILRLDLNPPESFCSRAYGTCFVSACIYKYSSKSRFSQPALSWSADVCVCVCGHISIISDEQIDGQTSRLSRSWLAESRFTCKYTQKSERCNGPGYKSSQADLGPSQFKPRGRKP